jgi:hypothetical protein
MDKQVANTVINLINGLECTLMRQTFLELQEDENATNEQLVQDAQNWNKFLDSYCALYRKTNPSIPIQ